MTKYTPEQAAKIADTLAYDAHGLVPAVAQQHDTGEVLMLAWMSREAVVQTLTTGEVTYHSRSRGERWRKGATSGNTQRLMAFRVDCDADTVLVWIDQTGPACHTGRRSCFYREAAPDGLHTVESEAISE
jgi:phosphoribosyl-AMP cyclohydrolase